MKDIRPKAEEKARRKAEGLQQGAPPGDGFMSERTRAKEALREEVNTYTGENVRKIAATTAAAEEDRILRVAAYCRVSTDDIDQLLSIELQKNNYRDMIKANPKWKYVGTYVDDGFSGTNTDHRPAFKLMMRDAMAGKIDMIITKSVSRFARNLLDCIGWVRKLKERDPPIQVFFEQEHLNTLDTTSNIILFVLAMVAEEESHMKSEAMLLSLEWRFSRGRFLTPALLGYDKVEIPDGHGGHKKVLQINEEEAKTVRLIYYLLLNGYSTAEVADQLQRTSNMKYVIEKTKTNAGTRVLPMNDDVATCFQTIIEEREVPKVEKMVDGYSGFLFLDEEGMPLVAMHWEHRLNHMVKRYNEIFREQMPNITPHVCRHTYCSIQARAGMYPKTLQYLMGHSDISVTMNTYTHLGLEDAVDEMNRMQQLESARKEQEALSGKTDEVKLSKKHFRAG